MRLVKDITDIIGMPTYVDDGSEEQPTTDSYFLIAKNGFFKFHKTAEIDTVVKMDKLPGPIPEQNSNAVVKWTGPKLSIEDFWFVKALFKKVYEKIKTEFDVQLYYSDTVKKFYIRLPHQKVTGASVDWELRDDDAWYVDQKKVEDNKTLPEDLRHIGRMHSHNTMSAFWSDTDKTDQEKQEYGIQIVMGKIMDAFEYKCRIVYNSNLVDVNFDDVVEGHQDPFIEIPEDIFIKTPATTYQTSTSQGSQAKSYSAEYYKNLKNKKKRKGKSSYYKGVPYGPDYWDQQDEYGYPYGGYDDDPFTEEDTEEEPDTVSSNVDQPPTGIEKFFTYPDYEMFEDPELKTGLETAWKDVEIIHKNQFLEKDIDFSWLTATAANMVSKGFTEEHILTQQLKVLTVLAMFISYAKDDLPEDQLSMPTVVLFSDMYQEYYASTSNYTLLKAGTKVSAYVDAHFVISVLHRFTLLTAYLTKRFKNTKDKGVEKFMLALTSNNGYIINEMEANDFLDTMETISEISRIPAFLFCTSSDCNLAGMLADIITGAGVK